MSDNPTLATQLAQLAEWDEHRHCRTINHPWKVIEVDPTHPDGTLWRLRCPSCGSERHDLYRRGTRKLSRRYEYAEGYQLTKSDPDDEVPTRAELTRMLRQITEDIAERRLRSSRVGSTA